MSNNVIKFSAHIGNLLFSTQYRKLILLLNFAVHLGNIVIQFAVHLGIILLISTQCTYLWKKKQCKNRNNHLNV